jgi:hypothetical protein
LRRRLVEAEPGGEEVLTAKAPRGEILPKSRHPEVSLISFLTGTAAWTPLPQPLGSRAASSLALACCCRNELAESGETNGARGTPAGAEKQRWLQRADEPQFSPFEQPEKVKKLLTLLKLPPPPSVP